MFNLLTKTTTEKPLSKLLALAILVTMAVVAMMMYQIHWNNNYNNSTERLDARETYERKYKQYQAMPMPAIVAMKTEVDIYPSRQVYRINGDYRLKNTSDETITKVFVTAANPLQALKIGGAKQVLHDTTWSVFLFELQQPMAPGAELSMSYTLEHSASAFAITRSNVANGTFIEHSKFEPLMGYVKQLEIQDKYERQNRGLPTLLKNSKAQPSNNKGQLFSEKRQFETIVSTAADQTAIASGQLIGQWQDGGRNYFHYKLADKVYPANLAYFSGRYAIKKVSHQGLDIEMYYDPDHGANIDEMLRSIKATYEYLSVNFGAYPFDSLRVIEVPAYHPFGGKASAGVIAMTEGLYTEDYTDGALINNVARNTIHEFAHQWWGEKMVPKIIAGEGVLVESMAKYFEVVILEQLIGKTMAGDLTKYNQRRYFSGRAYAHSSEVALTSSENQNYLNYGKGPISLLALRELMGETKLNTALKKLIDKNSHAMTATIDDLMDEIYAVADNNQHTLIDDWFNKVIEYQLSVDNAQITPMQNGQYSVEFDIKASRSMLGDNDRYTPTTIDEPLQVALTSTDTKGQAQSVIIRQTHQITQQTTNIKLVVDNKPEYVLIDPDFTRLDKNLADNTVKIAD